MYILSGWNWTLDAARRFSAAWTRSTIGPQNSTEAADPAKCIISYMHGIFLLYSRSQPANGYGKIHGITCCITWQKWLRSRGKLFREKGGRLYSEISALIYESNIDEKISVKNARKILCGISVLISAIKHKFSTNGGINPTKFVSNFRVNCRHPKAIASRGRDKWLDLLVHPTASSCCRPISCLNLNTLCKLRSPS